MGGGLMQLVAYGAQDIYLTGNPQITFFKVVYRRHTNFAMEAIVQTFEGKFDFGRKCTLGLQGGFSLEMGPGRGGRKSRRVLTAGAHFLDCLADQDFGVGLCKIFEAL